MILAQQNPRDTALLSARAMYILFRRRFQRENKLLGCNVLLILIIDIVPSL